MSVNILINNLHTLALKKYGRFNSRLLLLLSVNVPYY